MLKITARKSLFRQFFNSWLVCFFNFIKLFIIRAAKAINRQRGIEAFSIKEEEKVAKDKPNLEDGELADEDEKKVIFMTFICFFVFYYQFVLQRFFFLLDFTF